MSSHFLEIGLLSWLLDDTLGVFLLIEYFECCFYVFIRQESLESSVNCVCCLL